MKLAFAVTLTLISTLSMGIPILPCTCYGAPHCHCTHAKQSTSNLIFTPTGGTTGSKVSGSHANAAVHRHQFGISSVVNGGGFGQVTNGGNFASGGGHGSAFAHATGKGEVKIKSGGGGGGCASSHPGRSNC